ncbi:MAG: class I SAM-dependent methyltransferase [gamma proteobacterium symbiont of Lucinoma myriamae]|nr:class I SAM-dependent methyltransferase [gamma proteobacterium symbiont of Lucinoma myriamae]MCU7819175.1 class I SAM-dependent methyltransferase [gamma proteobacterium symbiont of Lucinoma myriamae]
MQTVRENLKQTMLANFTVENLVVDKKEFQHSIQIKEGQIGLENSAYQEYELSQQRDLSLKFHWGHDHDFGSFFMKGRMGDRHITLIDEFCSLFNIDLDFFKYKKIFDVGSWTGGTALLLSALSKEVYSIEEVSMYEKTTQYLVDSFALDNLQIQNCSLYSCNTDDLYEKFDVIYFPGVLYHLSDPLIALRILYNSCKIGGNILVETAGIEIDEPYCRYEGSMVYHGAEEEQNRGGWNWFVPSPVALERMLYAAGFDEIEISFSGIFKNRIYAVAKKTKLVGITKAGLSVQAIR